MSVVQCPRCGTNMTVGQSAVEFSVACPSCGIQLKIPATMAPPPGLLAAATAPATPTSFELTFSRPPSFQEMRRRNRHKSGIAVVFALLLVLATVAGVVCFTYHDQLLVAVRGREPATFRTQQPVASPAKTGQIESEHAKQEQLAAKLRDNLAEIQAQNEKLREAREQKQRIDAMMRTVQAAADMTPAERRFAADSGAKAKRGEPLTRREAAAARSLLIGSVNRAVDELEAKGLVGR